jgi:integrase
VADTLKQKGVAEGIISEILGHANQSISTGRYGKRYRPSVLLEALIRLDYLDFL